MALSDRDYVTRRKKKRKATAGSGSRRSGGETWMGVNRNFVLGALIVIIACVAIYVLRVLQSQG
jgi:hypothetical protein